MPIKKYTVNKFIAGMANVLSTALSPLLMPTYGVFLIFWVSVLCLLPYGQRVTHLLVCMGITCIIPLIFLSVLRHFKLITGTTAHPLPVRCVVLRGGGLLSALLALSKMVCHVHGGVGNHGAGDGPH